MRTVGRVQQRTVSEGAGPFVLSGPAAVRCLKFSERYEDGEELYVLITAQNDAATWDAAKWQTGVFHYDAGTDSLTIVRPIDGSNGRGIPVSFGPGSKDVFADAPDELLNRRQEFAFDWGDASPLPLLTVLAGKVVERVELYVSTGFDGLNPLIRVGDAADPGRLLAVDPTDAGAYDARPALRYGAATPLLLTITPGAGATRGGGILVIETQT